MQLAPCEQTHARATRQQSATRAFRLIEPMGFKALDVASMIAPPAAYLLFGEDSEPNRPPALIPPAPIATNFEASSATPELLAQPGVQVPTIAGSPQVGVAGHIGQDTEVLMLAHVRGPKKQEQLRDQVAQHNALVAAGCAPSARDLTFAPLPMLGYRTNAQAPL